MHQARTFALAVSCLALAYGAVGYLLLPQAAFEGDLTRMAMMPERQFGWTRPQPAVNPAELRQAKMSEADVLVIGDSFSMPHIWQGALTRDGLKVRTEHWDNLRAVCTDLPAYLRSQGFQGRHVVLQVVERNLERVVDASLGCAVTRYRRKHPVDADPVAPAPSHDRDSVNRSGRMSVGLRAQFHGLWYARQASAAGFETWQITPEVRVSRVPGGCERFSHPACQDALFLAEDSPRDLPQQVVDKMVEVTQRLSDWSVTWAVVPNKSTVYLHPNKKFWELAQTRLRAPDLLGMTQQALARGQVDLYLGNNTHFSTEGYQLMGAVLKDAMLSVP